MELARNPIRLYYGCENFTLEFDQNALTISRLPVVASLEESLRKVELVAQARKIKHSVIDIQPRSLDPQIHTLGKTVYSSSAVKRNKMDFKKKNKEVDIPQRPLQGQNVMV